jgi:ABC-type transporter Mla MlaB component
MALFSKLPVKKPGQSRASANAGGAGQDRATSESGWRPAKPGTGGIAITGFGLVEPSPTRRIIEVTHGNAGMCAVLENAVLLFASGHAEPARALLAEGIESDKDTRASPLAWLALFDLVQRAADRSAFEQLALQYVVQFERSAPTWDDRVRATGGPHPAPGGYVGVTGRLTAASATQLESLRRAIAKNASQARFDLAAIAEFDDAGARLLADVLGEARLRGYPLRLQRPEKLTLALEAAVKRGRSGGEGAWLLSLEFLQWQNDRAAFDDRAVDYAVTFEVSPPSWDPPEIAQATAAQGPDTGAAAAAAGETVADDPDTTAEVLALSGVVSGSHPEQVVSLTAFAEEREVVPVDMTQIERVDFVGAGAVYNAIKAIEERRKAVQIFGATPIIRAILLLIGVSPGHFFKKGR